MIQTLIYKYIILIPAFVLYLTSLRRLARGEIHRLCYYTFPEMTSFEKMSSLSLLRHWVFARSNGTWSQLGNKLSGTGASGSTQQGNAVWISADGSTVIVGGHSQNSNLEGTWIFSTQN